jgi:hypothetical protein
VANRLKSESVFSTPLKGQCKYGFSHSFLSS